MRSWRSIAASFVRATVIGCQIYSENFHSADIKRGWRSVIYAQYEDPVVERIDGDGIAQVFICKMCTHQINRFQDTQDCNSTKALHKHAKACLTPEIYELAMHIDSQVTYARDPLTENQMRYTSMSCAYVTHLQFFRIWCCRWIVRRLRSFQILRDPEFLTLMKTGRPSLWVPSASTARNDTMSLFKQASVQIARHFQVIWTINLSLNDCY